MMRQEYIAELEEIRKQTIKIGQAFAAVDLTDATGMERDRRKKTKKLVADLFDRLYEDIAISAKVMADNAEAGIGEQGDLFDEAARAEESTEAEAEVVEVPALEYKPEAEKPAAPEVATCKHYDGDGCTKKDAPCADGVCDGKDDGCQCYKPAKGKKGKRGKKGGKA